MVDRLLITRPSPWIIAQFCSNRNFRSQHFSETLTVKTPQELSRSWKKIPFNVPLDYGSKIQQKFQMNGKSLSANCSIIIDDDANWNFERNRPIKECPLDSRGVKYGNGISVGWWYLINSLWGQCTTTRLPPRKIDEFYGISRETNKCGHHR